MEILGKLGVDPKLLIAQIINFGLLLWLLKKLVYKPVVSRLEQDEKKLKQAEQTSKILEQQKQEFIQRKNQLLLGAKQQAQKIIKEAEEIAQKIKLQAQDQAAQNAAALLARTQAKLKATQVSLQKAVRAEVKNSLKEKMLSSFSQTTPPSFLKQLQQSIFFTNLIDQLKQLHLENLKKSISAQALQALEIKAKTGSSQSKTYEKALQKIIAQRLGPIVLEYALPLTKTEKQKLEKLLAEKLGLQIKISQKQNKKLISGFRFEIAGNLLEHNLASLLSDSLTKLLNEQKRQG